MRAFCFILALTIINIARLWADKPEEQIRHSEKSQNGHFSIEFTPSERGFLEGEGRVFSTSDGLKKELYSVPWYANEAVLSNDGHYLVRYGPWATDKSGHTDLAIAFYRDGKLLKSYLVKDLVKDPSKVDESVSHYLWRAVRSNMIPGFSADETRCTVVTSDKNVYEFNVSTGKILGDHKDPTAMSNNDVWKLEKNQADALAKDYIKRTPKLDEFSKLYSFSQLSAKNGVTMGVSLEGSEWFGDMHPLNPQLSRAMAETVFIIDPKTDQVNVSIDPQKLEQYLIDLGNVPFVKELLSHNPQNGYRIRAAGSHYHWNSKEVARIITAFSTDGSKSPPLDNWIYFIVDSKGAEGVNYISFYHPAGSDIFVMDGIPNYYPFTAAELARLKPVPGAKSDQMAVINSEGKLQKVLTVPFGE